MVSLGKRRVVDSPSDDESEVGHKRSRTSSPQEAALAAMDRLLSDDEEEPRIVKQETMRNGHMRQNGHAPPNGREHAGSEESEELSEDEEVNGHSQPPREPGFKRSYDRGDDG